MRFFAKIKNAEKMRKNGEAHSPPPHPGELGWFSKELEISWVLRFIKSFVNPRPAKALESMALEEDGPILSPNNMPLCCK